MLENKIALFVDKVLTGSKNSKDTARIIEELTSGPIVFTEKDFAEYLKRNHPKAPVKIKLEDDFAKVKVGYSIFHLTFICSLEPDPSGKIVCLRLKKGLPLKRFLKIEEKFHQLGFLSYDNSTKTISCDLVKIPQVAHLTKDIELKIFRINKNAVEIEFEKSSGAGGIVKEGTDEEFERGAIQYGFSRKFDEEVDKGIAYVKGEFETKLVIGFIGAVNTGKSTTVNALFRKDLAGVSPIPGKTRQIVLYPVDEEKLLYIADSPGLFDVNKGLSKQSAKFVKNEADIILYFVSADRGVDINDKKAVNKLRKSKKPFVVILNKIDLIEEAEHDNILKDCKRKLKMEEAIPISAKQGTGLNQLNDLIFEKLESHKKELLYLKGIKEKDRYVHKWIILPTSAVAAVIGATPLPGSDIVPLTALQAGALVKIARIYGCRVDKAAAKSTIMATLTGQVGRTAFRQLIKLIPVWGSAVSAGIAGAFTYGILKAGQAYYKRDMSIPPEDLWDVFQKAYKGYTINIEPREEI